MRGCLLLLAAAASAQENRGFVNPSLVTRNFVQNSLKAKATTPIVSPRGPASLVIPSAPLTLQATPPPAKCAIPLLQVPVSKDVDSSMVIPMRKPTGDDKMILPTIPVCGQR